MLSILKRFSSDSKSSIHGALAIQFISRYSNVLLQLLITAILARLISPEEFGTVAIVTVFTTFFATIADMGLSPAIVQNRDLTDDDLSGLLTFAVVFGLLLASAFYCCSGIISAVYRDELLIPLCRVASLSVLFSSADMVPNGVLLRDRSFLGMGFRLLFATVVSGACACSLAVLGYGVWSLIWQSVISSTVVFLWNLIASGIRIGNVHFIKPLRKVLSYSLFQAGFTTVNYFSRNLDNLLIGRSLGRVSLGYYDKAYRLTMYPTAMLASVIGSTLQPFLSAHQDDTRAILDKWKKIAKILSLIAVPIATVLFCCSEEVVLIMFGNQWIDSIPLFQVLCVSLYFQIVNNPSGAIFQSCNHTDYMFLHSLAATTITIVLLLFGLSLNSLYAVACCVSLAYCLHTVSIFYFLIHKSLGGNVLNFAKSFIPEAIIGLFAASLCSLCVGLLPSSFFVRMFTKVTLLVLVFIFGYSVTGQLHSLREAFPRR